MISNYEILTAEKAIYFCIIKYGGLNDFQKFNNFLKATILGINTRVKATNHKKPDNEESNAFQKMEHEGVRYLYPFWPAVFVIFTIVESEQ